MNHNAFLSVNPIPSRWLSELTSLNNISVRDALNGSAYYPACGFDGRVVQYASWLTDSFVYVDLRLKQRSIQVALEAPDAFKGYRLWRLRKFDPSELEGEHILTAPTAISVQERNAGRRQPLAIKECALWAIYERSSSTTSVASPARFSLLFIGGEGVDIYQRLYYSNAVVPILVAVIQPGFGFGGNWTDFTNPTQIFARTVMANPHGIPAYLFYGGDIWRHDYPSWKQQYRHPCWPEYENLVRFWGGRSMDWMLGLWQRGYDSTPCRTE